MSNRLRFYILLLFFGCLAPPVRTLPQDQGFTEKVEVNVRTVLAVVTDAKGNPIVKPLSADEVEVLEDGIPARVLGVDAVRPAKTAGSAAIPIPRTEEPVTTPPAVLEGVAQILYLDASLLQRRSIKKLCGMTAKNLDSVLARGPLEIVLADPEPKTVLTSASDPVPIRAALAYLGGTAQGRDRIFEVRAEFLPGASSVRSGAGMPNPRMRARIAIGEEIQLVRQSLERLGRWAGRRVERNPAVLYLANDGFDLILSDFYRNYLSQNDLEQIRMEFDPQIPKLVGEAASLLAERGLMTIPLAIGGSEAFFANSPSVVGKRQWSEMRNAVSEAPTFLFVRPLESLRQAAAATGGEVVTREDRFALALDRLSNAVAITYRMERAPDGKVHRLEIRSRRNGVLVRAAQSVLSGTSQTAAAARSLLALEKPAGAGGLPLEVRVDLLEVGKNHRRVGEIHVSADLSSIEAALEKVGPGRIRVTFAVQTEGKQPFVHHDEMDLVRDGSGATWLYDAPFQWPPDARRVAVTVEELRTGVAGTAVAELPKPD